MIRKMQSAQLPQVTNLNSWEDPAERWRYECRSEQEDTVRMEPLEEYVGGPMR